MVFLETNSQIHWPRWLHPITAIGTSARLVTKPLTPVWASQTYVSTCVPTMITFGMPGIKVTRRRNPTKPSIPDDVKRTCNLSKKTQPRCFGWERATANCTSTFIGWGSTRMGSVTYARYPKLHRTFYWSVLNTEYNVKHHWRAWKEMGVNINIPDVHRHSDASRLVRIFVDETRRTIWSIDEPEMRRGAKRLVMSKREPSPYNNNSAFLSRTSRLYAPSLRSVSFVILTQALVG